MDISIEQMLKAGVHFGHQTRFWNPKMENYIFGDRNKVHIINLEKTLELLKPSIDFCSQLAASNNRILFVGTKRAASRVIKEEAERCNMPYVNYRWLGGMLTNYKTVRASIRRLEILKTQEEEGKFESLTKKEVLGIKREMDKLERSIGGIKNMGGLPEALFVVDVKNEKIAVSEARKMGIPIIGIVDTNSDPDCVDYIIPGNDDAIRSVSLLTRIISNACLEGASKATGIVSGDGPVIVRKGEEEKTAQTLEDQDQTSSLVESFEEKDEIDISNEDESKK
ncbi:MAG: 30S ribosomal protein S2 [Pseudomonadota bacterium]|nr:30S ribosomal protein S2 [Pseudomonadota bacterium]MEC8169032.1 30S ribosomal protein S2 [Pseudomonadota bacterium]